MNNLENKPRGLQIILIHARLATLKGNRLILHKAD